MVLADIRNQRNLRTCHTQRSDWRRALLAADRCVELLDGDAEERRDRGAVLLRVGATSLALADLRSYLELRPDAADREAVERLVAQTLAMAN